jgi:hypothetical protein
MPLSRFGVDRFAVRDQWPALKRAAEAAAHDGLSLIADPDATYRHDGPLTLDGVSFDGQGCTMLALSDGPQALRCIGNAWRLANVTLLGVATERSGDDWRNGVWIGGGGATATGFVLENVTVDAAAPGRGVAAAGILFDNAHAGRIIRPIVRHSRSDGIHITNGSSDLDFSRPLSESTGDDGFAVVSYRRQKQPCRAIRVADGISRDSAARGFSVVGGRDVVYARTTVERSAAAGVYLYGEASYDTFGVDRCRLVAPVLRDCATGKGMSPGFSNAALIVGGREGEDRIGAETITRGATDCVIENPVVRGAGPACTAAISLHEYAIRPRVTGADLAGIIAPPGGRQPDGFEVNGRDVVIEAPRMRDIAGVAIVIGPHAHGTCLVDRPVVTRGRVRPGSINSFVFADAAPELARLVIRGGRFAGSPGQLMTSLLPAPRLQLEGNRLL